jgi:hypothetical protein
MIGIVLMFDRWGGSGWEVELPDGSIEMYYVDLPESVNADFRLQTLGSDLPTRHLNQPSVNTSIQALAAMYIDYLARLVNAAKAHFAPS